jgi:hypothetical protein
MAYYLHAYFLVDNPLPGEPPIENVGCVLISTWEIQRRTLPVEDETLMVRHWPDAMIAEGRIWHSAWELKPGNRFYIVENDPLEVQRPNGPIVWKWVDGVETRVKPRPVL